MGKAKVPPETRTRSLTPSIPVALGWMETKAPAARLSVPRLTVVVRPAMMPQG